jgi:hypothetical protein
MTLHDPTCGLMQIVIVSDVSAGLFANFRELCAPLKSLPAGRGCH